MEREVMSIGILQLQVFTVATAPDATKYLGCIAYFSNGAAGNPCLAFSNGTNWIRADDASTAIATG